MEQSILIKNVLLDDKKTNVLVEGNRFSSLVAASDTPATKVIDAEGMAIVPPFYNTHTHASMVLLRGYADDMPLMEWLTQHVWPYEAKMTGHDMYKGTRLAALEMIKSGTVFFNDMYFEIDDCIRAVEEMGIRACIGITMMDEHSKAIRKGKMDWLERWQAPEHGRIQLAMAPHSVYCAGEETYRLSLEVAAKYGMRVHTHLSETAQEVSNCVAAHGMTPVHYLDSLGVLNPNLLAAHVVHVDQDEIELLAERGVIISHNPCSNMKLSSGIMPTDAMVAAGCRMTLGTDGCSSNNALDMREEMKFAALLAKVNGKPESLPATEIFKWATVNGAQAFGIDAGEIAVGKLADALLIDLRNERMAPCYNLISNLVYAADSSCIDTVICDGRVLMEHHHVDGEEEIIADVHKNYHS